MAPNMYRGLSPIYMHNLKTTRHIYKDILPIKGLLDYRQYLFSGLELYARYDW